jgi:hypothetical protein
MGVAGAMTYHERNRRVRHLWKIGLNTFEIAETLSLTESDVERIVFEYLSSRKRRRAMA